MQQRQGHAHQAHARRSAGQQHLPDAPASTDGDKPDVGDVGGAKWPLSLASTDDVSEPGMPAATLEERPGTFADALAPLKDLPVPSSTTYEDSAMSLCNAPLQAHSNKAAKEQMSPVNQCSEERRQGSVQAHWTPSPCRSRRTDGSPSVRLAIKIGGNAITLKDVPVRAQKLLEQRLHRCDNAFPICQQNQCPLPHWSRGCRDVFWSK